MVGQFWWEQKAPRFNMINLFQFTSFCSIQFSVQCNLCIASMIQCCMISSWTLRPSSLYLPIFWTTKSLVSAMTLVPFVQWQNSFILLIKYKIFVHSFLVKSVKNILQAILNKMAPRVHWNLSYSVFPIEMPILVSNRFISKLQWMKCLYRRKNV